MTMKTDFVETAASATSLKDVATTFRPEVVRYRQQKKRAIARNQNQNNTSVDLESVSPNADEPTPESVGIISRRFSPSWHRIAPREITLQEWEGRVLEVRDRFFVARLVDLTANETEETEEVQILVDDVPDADQKLLQPGAIFRWVLGYSYALGRKERFARVILRRLPVWTEREMQEADREAQELHDALFGSHENWSASAG
jgi:hypothetical protein